MFVIFLIPVIFGFICAKKESKVTSLYSSFGVYGRIYAYITISLMVGALMALAGGILALLAFREDYEGIGAVGVLLYVGVIAAVLMFIGIRMYTAAKKSCPSGLRKKLFISMVITAFGCGMKIVLFFMPMVWALTEPTEIIGSDGSKMTVLGQDVYDRNGNLVGSVTDRGPKSMTVRRR